MFVAYLEQRLPLVGSQFVGRAIAASVLEKGQRTVVENQVFREKGFCAAEALRKKPPETLAAHFRARTSKPAHNSFWMFLPRFDDLPAYCQPIPNGSDFAKRNPCLRHPKRPWIHADEHDVPSLRSESP